jgi:hypothetical protein
MAAAAWEEARGEILRRITSSSVYESRGVVFTGAEDTHGNRPARCPMHDDSHPSLSVNVRTGDFCCHADGCPASGGGSLFDWVMLVDGVSFRESFETLAAISGVEIPDSRPPIDGSLPAQFHQRLLEIESRMKYLADSRGLTRSTVEAAQIGWDGQRYTIPVYDEAGVLQNIRRYKPRPSGEESKFLNWVQDGHKYGESRLYRPRIVPWPAEGGRVVLCEGEMDCLVLHQAGIAATTSTGGSGSFRPEWSRLFRGLSVVICYDNDRAGRSGASRAAEILSGSGISVSVASLPDAVGEKGDVTDYFVALGGRSQEFVRDVLDKAKPWTSAGSASTMTAGMRPQEVSLPQSSEARFVGRPLQVSVMVSGKDTTPYVVPKRVKASCPVDGRKACSWCSMALFGGKREVEFGPDDRDLMAFTMSSDTQVKGLIVRKMGVAKCEAFKLEIAELQNLEEVRIIPEIDYFHGREIDEEYVVRQAMFLGQGLRSNRSYSILAHAYPDPRTQYSMLLIRSAVPSQDSIASFAMNDSIADELSRFKCAAPTADAVAEKFDAIAADLEANVHHIYQRRDMQAVMDLAWHSVIGFDVGSVMVRKGWVEALILGDSGQGKTEMSLCLLRHYGLGERVQGEQVSVAGLVGGVEQTAKRWMLTWGKMPLNDRRLLVVEEVQGMSVEDLARLSDVRSTGVAEITKMRTERTNARCRLIFIANPRSGRPVRSYDSGVETVAELFGKAEDVRRLDIAIMAASGEVPQSILNAVERPKIPHDATAAACKRLILWAWSRRPSQVRFDPSAIVEVYSTARAMGESFSAKIPLVEPADMRLKIARLAASAAARTFSTPEGDHETVLVGRHHVAFVVDFLNRQYRKPSMAYDEFSRIADSGERVAEREKIEMVRQFKTLPRWQALARELSECRAFRKGELVDAVGYDREESRLVFPVLRRMRAIRSTPVGFVKAPFFIELLREINGSAGND